MSNKKERKAYGAQLKMQASVRNRQQLRQEHLRSQNGQCFLCKKLLKFEQSVLGHVTPKSRGGDDSPANTFAAHESCIKRMGTPLRGKGESS